MSFFSFFLAVAPGMHLFHLPQVLPASLRLSVPHPLLAESEPRVGGLPHDAAQGGFPGAESLA